MRSGFYTYSFMRVGFVLRREHLPGVGSRHIPTFRISEKGGDQTASSSPSHGWYGPAIKDVVDANCELGPW
jgi:hypothetical protein